MNTHSNSENSLRRMEEMVSKLRALEFRLTPQRMAVLEVLAAGEGHPSVKEVHEIVKRKFPTTSIATIYKTVNLLKKINEILEISIPGGSKRYEGGKPFPHPHVICTRCKKVIDLDLGPLEDITTRIADDTGFEIRSHRLDFFGVCGDCKCREKLTPKQRRQRHDK